jgi:hypothetical protein
VESFLISHCCAATPLLVLLGISACALSSCASLHAYGIVLMTEYDGRPVIENEKNVVSYLEEIIKVPNEYAMRAFERKAISYRVKLTKGTTHSFYVIYDGNQNWHTVSFSATGKWATSQGAWAIDTNTDIESYTGYLYGENIWQVNEIMINNGISTLPTVENILAKINGNITYYFRSKINKDDAHDNCNSALMETLVENN